MTKLTITLLLPDDHPLVTEQPDEVEVQTGWLRGSRQMRSSPVFAAREPLPTEPHHFYGEVAD